MSTKLTESTIKRHLRTVCLAHHPHCAGADCSMELSGSVVLLAVAVSEWPVSRYCRRVPGKLRADRHMLPSRLVLARRCVHAVSGLAAICTMFMFAGA